MATNPFENIFSGILSGRSRGGCLPNLKFVSLAALELLAFNTHNLQGHVTLTTPPVLKFFQGSCRDFPWENARQIRMNAKLEVRIFNHFGAISI